MFQTGLHRWLQAPLVTGRLALLCGIAAVAIPTIVRAAIDGVVTGCEFTPYLPFVLITALALGWWQASAVAVTSAAILGGVVFGPTNTHFTSSCFLSSAGIFLASSAAMIGVVVLVRRTVVATLRFAFRSCPRPFALPTHQSSYIPLLFIATNSLYPCKNVKQAMLVN